MIKKITEIIQNSYVDEDHRRIVMFNLLNILLAAIAFIMTVVNLKTGEIELMGVTGVFTLLCLLNYVFVKTNCIKTSTTFSIFTVEAMVMLVYFVLSGIPQGFSVLWTLLVPAISLYVFGQKIGVRFSLLTLFMVIFFFWLPFGQSLLYYEYSKTFMLRFPFVYISLFAAALYIDIIRIGVYRQLKHAEENARYLYRHDALTGIFSRHAFYEELQQKFDKPMLSKVSILVFDVDDFKTVNDRYGHNVGDEVLKQVARTILKNTCEHCLSCRWGGEEFLVLMQCDHEPLEIAENIRRFIESTPICYKDYQLHITVSVGVATAQTVVKENLSDFINTADNAMYISKANGKNRITFKTYGN